jgi:hypothetical protein
MGFAHWMTPRFPLEMTFASALTLGAVFAFAATHRDAPAPQPAPVAASVAPKPAMDLSGPDPRDRLSRFVEQTALAHLGPLRPEEEIEAADTPRTPAAVELTNRAASAQERSRAPVARSETPVRTETVIRTETAARVETPLRPELAQPKGSIVLRPPLAIPPHNLEAANMPPEAPRLDGHPKYKATGFRLPAVSDLTSKLPSGRDISDGVASMGKKIGSIFH